MIYQAVLFDGRWQGRADFLRRVPIASKLGPWSYEVLDTKLARHAKPEYVHQLSIYSKLLALVQGRAPDIAYLLLGDGSALPIQLRRYAALHRYVVAQLDEESYSLKKLERHHGSSAKELRIREGGGSIVAYET